jgi:hypothetical protein
MNIEELISEIESGTFDSSLVKIKEAVDARLKVSRISRTIADYHIGDTVVFNDLTGTRYMVGRKATVREHLTDPELAAVMFAEAMAKDQLADGLVTSSNGMAVVAFRCGVQVRATLVAHQARKAQGQTPTAANDQRKQDDAA